MTPPGKHDAELEQQGYKKVHCKTEPYHQSGCPETVNFNYTVIDDIGYRKHHNTGRDGKRAYADGFNLHHVGDNQAYTKEESEHKKSAREAS